MNGSEKSGCLPHTVRFINNTIGANAFTWNFGDGTIVQTTKGIDTLTHTYTTAGNFNVALFASNSCNDTTDFEVITTYQKPMVRFTASSLNSCVTDTIRFTNQSDTGITFFWSFGDGTTSLLRDPKHVYTRSGTYRVSLIASRIFAQGLGCADSAFATIVIRDTLPGTFFISELASSCIPFTVLLRNQNLPSTNTTWNFGDGTSGMGDSISHTYTQSGNYVITMVSRSAAGCVYTTSKTIQVAAPAGTLTYNGGFVCSSRPVRFEVRSTNTTGYVFVFGDGDSVTTNANNINHQYTKPGVYLPYVYLLSGTCKLKIQTGDTIKVDVVKAGFIANQTKACGVTSVQFIDTSYSFYKLQSLRWNFGDGTSSIVSNPVKSFTQNSLFNVQLIAQSFSGCSDTLVMPLSIAIQTKPVSNIVGDSVACTRQPIIFSSFIQSQDSITNYNWSFGNGLFSIIRNPVTSFANAGIYQIQLVARTVFGCADTAYKRIVVNEAPIVNAGTDITICMGNTTQLIATGASTYQWSPLQGLNCSLCPNPVASPVNSTQYIVRGTNGNGCSNTDTIKVAVIKPFKITVSGRDTLCVGQQTQLFASGASGYLWSPTIGLNNSALANPTASPITTTQYQVIGKDDYNCFVDTAYVRVVVGNHPTVDVGTGSLVTAGSVIQLNPTITNGPIKTYTWTPAVQLSCTNCATPTATINNNITYQLEVENIYGCKATDTITYKVICEEALQVFIPNAFSPDGDGVNDILTVMGKGLGNHKILTHI